MVIGLSSLGSHLSHSLASESLESAELTKAIRTINQLKINGKQPTEDELAVFLVSIAGQKIPQEISYRQVKAEMSTVLLHYTNLYGRKIDIPRTIHDILETLGIEGP